MDFMVTKLLEANHRDARPTKGDGIEDLLKLYRWKADTVRATMHDLMIQHVRSQDEVSRAILRRKVDEIQGLEDVYREVVADLETLKNRYSPVAR